jgi:hypothetical protein
MISAEPAPYADRAVAQRALRRTLERRRRRFWRRVVVFVIVTAVMVTSALANRDMQRLRSIRKQGAALAASLQAYYEREKDLPLLFPKPHEDLYKDYHFNLSYADQARSSARVGVCCSKKPLWFLLRSDARVVVFFDGDKFSAELMDEARFRALASGLGFGRVLYE